MDRNTFQRCFKIFLHHQFYYYYYFAKLQAELQP